MSRSASQPPTFMVSPSPAAADDFLEAHGLLEPRALGLELGLDADDVVVLAQVLQLLDHLALELVHRFTSLRARTAADHVVRELLAVEEREHVLQRLRDQPAVGQSLGDDLGRERLVRGPSRHPRVPGRASERRHDGLVQLGVAWSLGPPWMP